MSEDLQACDHKPKYCTNRNIDLMVATDEKSDIRQS